MERIELFFPNCLSLALFKLLENGNIIPFDLYYYVYNIAIVIKENEVRLNRLFKLIKHYFHLKYYVIILKIIILNYY